MTARTPLYDFDYLEPLKVVGDLNNRSFKRLHEVFVLGILLLEIIGNT